MPQMPRPPMPWTDAQGFKHEVAVRSVVRGYGPPEDVRWQCTCGAFGDGDGRDHVPKKPTKRELMLERDAKVIALRNAGKTLAAIGDRCQLSPERVRQIIKRETLRGRKRLS